MISYNCLFLSDFTSLSMITSRSIHVAANGIISFFLWLIFHCVYIWGWPKDCSGFSVFKKKKNLNDLFGQPQIYTPHLLHPFICREPSLLDSPSLETYFIQRDNQNGCDLAMTTVGLPLTAAGMWYLIKEALGGLQQRGLILSLWGAKSPERFYTPYHLSCLPNAFPISPPRTIFMRI